MFLKSYLSTLRLLSKLIYTVGLTFVKADKDSAKVSQPIHRFDNFKLLVRNCNSRKYFKHLKKYFYVYRYLYNLTVGWGVLRKCHVFNFIIPSYIFLSAVNNVKYWTKALSYIRNTEQPLGPIRIYSANVSPALNVPNVDVFKLNPHFSVDQYSDLFSNEKILSHFFIRYFTIHMDRCFLKGQFLKTVQRENKCSFIWSRLYCQ